MQRIGKISGSKSRQEETNPVTEQMRQDLRRSFREEKIQRTLRKHMDEISGERSAYESVSDLLDNAGNPPANAPVESIIKQQRALTCQLRWLEAWSGVFDKRLRQLDSDRYWRERLAREHSELEEKRELREKKGLTEIDETNSSADSKLLKALEEAIESSYRSANLRQYLDADDLDAPVLGIRRVQSGLRCVFDAYLDPRRNAAMSADQQYTLVSEQLAWVGVMAAEIHSKLTIVIEIIEAALELSSNKR